MANPLFIYAAEAAAGMLVMEITDYLTDEFGEFFSWLYEAITEETMGTEEEIPEIQTNDELTQALMRDNLKVHLALAKYHEINAKNYLPLETVVFEEQQE